MLNGIENVKIMKIVCEKVVYEGLLVSLMLFSSLHILPCLLPCLLLCQLYDPLPSPLPALCPQPAGSRQGSICREEKSRQQSRQWVVEQAEEQEGGCRAGRGQAGDLEQAGGHRAGRRADRRAGRG